MLAIGPFVHAEKRREHVPHVGQTVASELTAARRAVHVQRSRRRPDAPLSRTAFAQVQGLSRRYRLASRNRARPRWEQARILRQAARYPGHITGRSRSGHKDGTQVPRAQPRPKPRPILQAFDRCSPRKHRVYRAYAAGNSGTPRSLRASQASPNRRPSLPQTEQRHSPFPTRRTGSPQQS